MKLRMKKYEEISPAEFLLLRERLGMGKYRKQLKREEEKRGILLELGLKKSRKREGRLYPHRLPKKKSTGVPLRLIPLPLIQKMQEGQATVMRF